MNWEEELLEGALSERALRAGAAYAGPGAGRDIPTSERPPIVFTGGLPDPSFLPAGALTAAATAVLAEETNAALQYGGAQGFEILREWLAGHWSRLDGMPLTAANYTLTNGSAGALANVCETFLDAGDVAIVEAPSFPGSIRTIRSVTPRVECVPVDDQGLDVDALEQVVASATRQGERVRLLYTIPNFQNPTGSTLTLDRRRRLIELCERHAILVAEDDAYGELGFEETPLPSLFSLAGGNGVIKLGSFSKIVAPGLRTGWCQATAPVVDALVATRCDMGSSPFVQRMLARFATSGELEDHILAVRSGYAVKCRTMLDELSRSCPDAAGWNRPTGGFFIWVTLDDSVDSSVLAAAALEAGVAFVSGRAFFAEQTVGEGPRTVWGPGESRYLRLAFSYVPAEQIAEGIRRLGSALVASRRPV
jgi:2-aminoadipate transaminase